MDVLYGETGITVELTANRITENLVMLINDMIKIYEFNIYSNSEIKKENIDELSKEIFANKNIDLENLFDIRKCLNKFCWKNYVRIFASTSTLHENKLKGIPLMFEFLQDANWPVYADAVAFLLEFETELLKPYIKKYLEQAYKDDDEMWINEIEKLACKMKINL